jgi:AmmeMemoRadiSam system protein A
VEEGAGRQLVAIARRSISQFVEAHSQYEPVLDQLPEYLRRPGASFVTLYLGDALRGCVGSVEAHLPLATDVAFNAVAAASRDPRFVPVSCDELPALHLSVTILSPLQRLAYVDDADLAHKLRPGLDGVMIKWRQRRSLLLPQVWERLPAPADFLLALADKAGIPCHELAAQPPSIEVFTFTAESCEEDDCI